MLKLSMDFVILFENVFAEPNRKMGYFGYL
jgi:hypothetical protein